MTLRDSLEIFFPDQACRCGCNLWLIYVIYELFCDREKRIKGKEGEGAIGKKEEQTQPKVIGQNVEQKLSCLVGSVSWSEWRLEWMCG